MIYNDEPDWVVDGSGTYSTNGNKITMIIDGESETFTYSATDNTFTMIIYGESITFTKTNNITYTYIGGLLKSPSGKEFPQVSKLSKLRKK